MRNQFTGGRAESVFMGRDIHGDVHFHGRKPRVGLCQIPAAPRHYTDNEGPLGDLDRWFADLADGPRVAIVRGAPGSGRTTLVNYWVQQHRELFPEGQYFVRLTPAAEEAEPEHAALGDLLVETGHAPDEIPASVEGRASRWRSWSLGKRIVLVVDDALNPAQVHKLLPGPGPSAVLVTEAGSLTGLVASASAQLIELDPMADDAARVLLGRIAGEDRVAAEPEAVDQLIKLCGGSTIALCVVATLLLERKRIASFAVKLAEDERALRALSRDEHLSVEVVFDAAYHRLDPLAQRCYQALGVHPGPGDVHVSALAVALGESDDDVEAALGKLTRAKLVSEPDEGRFLIAGLARQHARAKATDADDLRHRFIAHYWARSLVAEKLLIPGRGWREAIWPDLEVPDGDDVEAARLWLADERVNLRAVVEAAYRAGELDRVCQLAVALWPDHERGKHTEHMIAVNRLGVRAAEAAGDHLAAAVLNFQYGFAYRQRGDLDRAAEIFATALDFARQAGSLRAEATAVESLALVRLDQGDPEAAGLLERNLAMAREIGESRRITLARFHHAKVLPAAQALPELDGVRTGFATEPYNLVKTDLWRGRKLIETGEHTEAERVLTQAAKAAEHWHFERAQIFEALAELGDSRTRLSEALDIYRLWGFTAHAAAVAARLAALDET